MNGHILPCFSALDGVYYGSKSYSPAEGGWILENYLMGIHPATNGSSNPETVLYYEIIDDKSPHTKMQEYLEKIVPEVYKSRLLAYFIKNLKWARRWEYVKYESYTNCWFNYKSSIR